MRIQTIYNPEAGILEMNLRVKKQTRWKQQLVC